MIVICIANFGSPDQQVINFYSGALCMFEFVFFVTFNRKMATLIATVFCICAPLMPSVGPSIMKLFLVQKGKNKEFTCQSFV